MKPHKEEQKLTETPKQDAKRRFQIEQLEERIAPWYPCKVNGKGECVGPPRDRRPGGPL